MLIPDRVVEQLKTIDHEMPIYDSAQGWIDYLIRTFQRMPGFAKEVYDIVAVYVFTDYSSWRYLYDHTAAELMGSTKEARLAVLYAFIQTPENFVNYAILIFNGYPEKLADDSTMSDLWRMFRETNPEPGEWMMTDRMNHMQSVRFVQLVATFWLHTEASFTQWQHAIVLLVNKSLDRTGNFQMNHVFVTLERIASEKARAALAAEDPFGKH